MLKRPGFEHMSEKMEKSDQDSFFKTEDEHVINIPLPIETKIIREDAQWDIKGHLVPSLVLRVEDFKGAYFEPHDLLWKDESVNISVHNEGGILGTLGGMFKRGMTGTTLILASAFGSGKICLTRGETGGIHAVSLRKGQRVQLREGAFLAATNGITCGFERIEGIGNMLLGNVGLFLANFEAEQEGTLFVHGLGDVIMKELTPYQNLEVVQHGWLWKDNSVDMQTVSTSLGTAIMGSGSVLLHKFSGPGRVAIQTGRKQIKKSD